MRILLVIDDMHPRSGGPPVVVADSARALAARGHAVTIISAVQPDDAVAVRAAWSSISDSGVALHLCDADGVATLFGLRRAGAALKTAIATSDVVHIHGVWSPMLIGAGRIARRNGVPYFVSSHGVFDRRAMTRIRRKWLKKRIAIVVLRMRAFLENAAGVVFGSATEAEQSWLPSGGMRLTYVPNGADRALGTMPPSAADLARLHAAAPSLAGWRRTILCRSRIHPEKGIHLLVDAFNRIAPDFPDVGLLIAGLRQDDGYQARIASTIAVGPAADQIVLTTGLTGADSRFLYQTCDIFVMPSIAEGFSMALIEGLANGRPLLITRYCHMPTVAEAGAGMIVEPTAPALASGLCAMLAESADVHLARGVAARQLFEDHFTWEHVAASLEAEYSAALLSSAA